MTRTFEGEHEVVQGVRVELVRLIVVLLLVRLDRALHDLDRPLLSASVHFTVAYEQGLRTSRLWDMVAGAGVWTERLGAAHAQ